MQTLELENYGVAELNDTEIIRIDGGDFWDDALKVIRVFGYVAAVSLLGLALVILLGGRSEGGGGDGGGPSPTCPGIL